MNPTSSPKMSVPVVPPPETFLDFSGVSSRPRTPQRQLDGATDTPMDNPYDVLIEGCNNDPLKIQAAYQTHREARNNMQRSLLLNPTSESFPISLDRTLLNTVVLADGSKDPRNCLVFWARPPKRIRELVLEVQSRLINVAKNLWLMPQENLHMTVMEITHSRDEATIASLTEKLRPHGRMLTEWSHDPHRRATLVRPLVGFDGHAIALGFVPAAPESTSIPSVKPGLALPADILNPTRIGTVRASSEPPPKSPPYDTQPSEFITTAIPIQTQNPHSPTGSSFIYTYHHLRRDLYAQCSQLGIPPQSRYVVPSAHITVARYIDLSDFNCSPDGVARWISALDEVNKWLGEKWESELRKSCEGASGEYAIPAWGTWTVGEEKGLDMREGRLWYGGGETVVLGKGF